MKKLIVWILLAAIIFSLIGCSPAAAPERGYAAMDAAGVPGEVSDGSDRNNHQISAGVLTAGEWKDGDNLSFWTNLLNRNEWYELMEQRSLFTNNVVTAIVKDENGNGCFGVPVALCNDVGDVLYQAITDVNGCAYLLYGLKGEEEKAVSVRVSGKEFPVVYGLAEVLAEDVGLTVTKLDLMLMVDTTGSMSDELQYLQTELEDVINRIYQAAEGLSIHVSVNFYRDEDDDYLVRDFEFTADIPSAISQLKRQRTDGGGDYPEAVHNALENIVYEHQWRDGAVKLCFFVLDAPPHSEQEIQGINAQMCDTVVDAAKEGIRIIPVASSGVNTETEFLLRSWALMTGGTYTFLTDHSGVGNDHLEPTIGQYEVEALNECLIRVISEYCALEYVEPTQ